MLDRDAAGNLIRKAGVMGIVLTGSTVQPGDAIRVMLPDRLRQDLPSVRPAVTYAYFTVALRHRRGTLQPRPVFCLAARE